MKRIFMLISIIMMMLVQDVYASIDFVDSALSKTEGMPRRVINTGYGYFTCDYAPWSMNSFENNIYYSKNKINWDIANVNIKDGLGLFDNMTFPKATVIETPENFIFCDTSTDKGESFGRVGHIKITDKSFNTKKEIETERISDISYINGVCYINKYLEYVSDKPRDGITNIVTKQTSYYSSDFSNWNVYKEEGGIPIMFNKKKFFVKHNLKDAVPDETGKYPYYSDVNDKNSEVSLINNNEEISILYESINFSDLLIVKDYLFALPKYVNGHYQNNIAVSKDGIYFTIIQLPIINEYNQETGEKVKGIYELENGDLEVCCGRCYRFSSSDLEKEIRNGNIYVQFQDKILGFETPPIIENGSTLVPMRFLFEQMGADVEWNGETQIATATLDNKAVTFAIDDTNAEVNNTPATMDVPARLINGKTMVPLRFLSEEMGFEVTWNPESRTAIIE